MKTYYIETYDSEVLGYYKTLHGAKLDFNSLVHQGIDENDMRIVMIKGSYFGEGFYQYQVIRNKGVLKKKYKENK